MGLFDKKYCSICNEKIGLLGNRKLEDGNLCKNCAGQLSRWFSERRHSTVSEIQEQLAYREENKKKVAQFQTTRSFGDRWRVLIDDNHGWFTATNSRNMAEENPDILDFSALTGCRLDIDENRTELMREDKEGKEVSYVPPRYEYRYDFDIIITVNNPYFDEMRFQLNDSSVEIESGGPAAVNRSVNRAMPGNRTMAGNRSLTFDPSTNLQYQQYKRMGDEICEALSGLRAGGQNPQVDAAYGAGVAAMPGTAFGGGAAAMGGAAYEAGAGSMPGAAPAAYAAPAPAADGPWTCPACGGQNNGGKFCECCGTPRS